jgi:addiction module HigA family antidote
MSKAKSQKMKCVEPEVKGPSMRMHNPPHPGLVLRKYLGDLAVTTAAAHLQIMRVTLSRVLNSKAGISALMAFRLAAALGTTPDLWMNMQAQYDLWRARQGRQPAVRRFAHAAETAVDFFKKRRGRRLESA